MKWLIFLVVAAIGLLGLFVYCSAGAKFDRQQRKFRRWLKATTPKGKKPPNIP